VIEPSRAPERATGAHAEAFMRDCFTVLDGGPGWPPILNRFHVATAIVANDTSIAPIPRASPAWRVQYADEQTLTCARVGAVGRP
jgi:hypothetical protein